MKRKTLMREISWPDGIQSEGERFQSHKEILWCGLWRTKILFFPGSGISLHLGPPILDLPPIQGLGGTKWQNEKHTLIPLR